MKRMVEIYGIREVTVCLQRLINISLSLERNREYSIIELSARSSLDEKMVKNAIEGLEFFGLFRRKNNKYFVPDGT